MIRQDRELLAELGRLNSDVVPFATKMMDESVTVTTEEQYAFARGGCSGSWTTSPPTTGNARSSG